MVDAQSDTIELKLYNHGAYRIRAYRVDRFKRESEIDGSSVMNSSFDQILYTAIEYHNLCLQAYEDPAKVDRMFEDIVEGHKHYVPPQLVPWKLDIRCDLPKYQNDALVELIAAHNQSVAMIVKD